MTNYPSNNRKKYAFHRRQTRKTEHIKSSATEVSPDPQAKEQTPRVAVRWQEVWYPYARDVTPVSYIFFPPGPMTSRCSSDDTWLQNSTDSISALHYTKLSLTILQASKVYSLKLKNIISCNTSKLLNWKTLSDNLFNLLKNRNEGPWLRSSSKRSLIRKFFQKNHVSVLFNKITNTRVQIN